MTTNKLIYDLLFDFLASSILISGLCCISIYMFYKSIINKNEMKRYFLISLITGIVLKTGSYILILPILTIITFVQLKNNDNVNKVKILILIYLIYFVDVIIDTFFHAFFSIYFYKFTIVSIKYSLIELALLFIIIALIYMGTKIFTSSKKSFIALTPSKIRSRMIISISLPLSIVILMIFPFVIDENNAKFNLITSDFIPQILPLVSILLTTIIVYNYDKSVINEVKLKREIEEKRRVEEYSHVIEEMYSETRKFKHDYINLLTSLKEYIDGNNVNELREFFYKNIIDMDKDIKWNNSNIDKLRFIKNSGFKAILSTKLIKAVSMNIDIKVDIIENIDNIPMNVIDLCRITGILLDNAIEAAEECEYPKLYLCIVYKKDYIVISIHNNFFGEKPAIHKIYQQNFSTKGSSRGLGLYNVKNIIDTKYNNVFINTSIEQNMFIQELWIKEI